MLNAFGLDADLDFFHNALAAEDADAVTDMFSDAFDDLFYTSDDDKHHDYNDYDDDMECVDGVHEFADDCMEIAADYVDGLEECEYFQSYDCESWEEISCEVAALINDEWVYESCEYMMETYDIPEPEE